MHLSAIDFFSQVTTFGHGHVNRSNRTSESLCFALTTSQILCSVSVILHVSLITEVVALIFKRRR